jgi:hypothetical protein
VGERLASVRQSQPKHGILRPGSSHAGEVEAGCRRARRTSRGADTTEITMTPDPRIPDAEDPVSRELAAIARKHLGLETLATRSRDQLDFHSLAVWCIADALEAAYQAGRAAAKREGAK